MRAYFLLVSLVSATLAWGLDPATAQFEHPQLASGQKAVHKALILPPQVTVAKTGFKGAQSLIDEARQVESALPGIISGVLREHGSETLENPFTPQAIQDNPDLQYALADIQKSFDTLLKKMNRKPKDVREGRFTLGDEVTKVNPAAADAVVFVRGEGFVATALITRVKSSLITLYIAVVDGSTGSVLYYARAHAQGDFLRDPKHMTKAIRKSFKDFAAAGKKEKV